MPRLFLLLIIACSELPAAEFTRTRGWLHANGYSRHFSADDANDRLLGLGFTYYTGRRGTWHTAWEGDVFRDSGRKVAGYVGYAWTRPTNWVSFGVTAALMHHRNFAAHNSLRILPVALPFLETRGERIKARIYYIPPIRRPSDHQVAVQLLLPLLR